MIPHEPPSPEGVFSKILGNLSLWQNDQRLPPKPKSLEIQIDSSDSRLPFNEEGHDQYLKLPAVGAGNLPCKVKGYFL